MKKNIFLIVVFINTLQLFYLNTKAQTISEDYVDGWIWFRITESCTVKYDPQQDPQNLSVNSLPFLLEIAEECSFTKLSQPFFAAKNSQDLLNTYQFEFADHQKVLSIIKKIEASGMVVYAERVPLNKPCITPNDPNFSSQWHLSKINATAAWNYFSSGSNIVVAIVDDAIERSHSDLNANLWVNPGEIASNGIDDDNNGYIDDVNGYDMANNDNNPDPSDSTFSHGTHVAGIACARANNNNGVASIGYSTKLMCVKASSVASSISFGYSGIVYAVANKADIINISWGSKYYSATSESAMAWAYAQGAILVAGAGNNGDTNRFYPAAYPNVISVAGTNSGDVKHFSSTYGNWIDVSAPGHDIYSTKIGNKYGNSTGTSMASPLVAGLLALMKSLNPNLSKTDLINCLKSTAANINSSNPTRVGLMGAGRIDASAAMSCISSTLLWSPIADFNVSSRSICAGTSVTFTDKSHHGVSTNWNWTFPGGTPSTATSQSVTVTYNTPGSYSVSLTSSNANGNDSEIKSAYVTVYSTTAKYNSSFYSEGFEGSSIPNNDWIRNSTNSINWGQFSSASASGAKSVIFPNHSSSSGNIAELIGPSFDLSKMTSPTLTFKQASAPKSTPSYDRLDVYLSSDCGNSWTAIYSRLAQPLYSSGAITSFFIPTSTDWRQETATIPSAFWNNQNTMIKFKFTGGGGNNIFIDDINIFGNISGTEENIELTDYSVFPNPTDETCTIKFSLNNKGHVQLQLMDMLGKNIKTIESAEFSAGSYEYTLNSKTENITPGMYFIKSTVNKQQSSVIKLLIQ